MGLIGTIATFGVGYAAGAATGDKVKERLPERFQERLPERFQGALPGQTSEDPTLDLREVRQVMTAAPEGVRPGDSLQQAAHVMKDHDIGDVLVQDDTGGLIGIVTDRDIAIRATAEGRNPQLTPVGDVYTREVATAAPTDTVQHAIQVMRTRDIRRLPVVESGRAIGIVSLGDIAIETTPGSVLADISTASPDR
ncbi:MAG TPA: CBS domain-containing protein [Actinomycetota bacterium]|nr:CBS domain-containing protein [Actinomycetota bacterium]